MSRPGSRPILCPFVVRGWPARELEMRECSLEAATLKKNRKMGTLLEHKNGSRVQDSGFRVQGIGLRV